MFNYSRVAVNFSIWSGRRSTNYKGEAVDFKFDYSNTKSVIVLI